jgi:hypothetical protein
MNQDTESTDIPGPIEIIQHPGQITINVNVNIVTPLPLLKRWKEKDLFTMWMPMARFVRVLDDLNPSVNFTRKQYVDAWEASVTYVASDIVKHCFRTKDADTGILIKFATNWVSYCKTRLPEDCNADSYLFRLAAMPSLRRRNGGFSTWRSSRRNLSGR